MASQTSTTPPSIGRSPALDKSMTQKVYHGKSLGGRGKAARTKAWADEVAASKPQLVQTEHGMVRVEEIGPVRFASDRDIWERQPDENDKEWQMFQLFRDQPSWDRTKKNVAVALRLGAANSTGTSEHIGLPASIFRWDERVMAYDLAQDARMREELFQRKLDARVETARIGRRMRGKALEALNVLDAVVYKHVKDPKTGEVKRIVKSALSPNDIVKLADIGVKLERMALGEDDLALPPGSTINLTQINTQLVGMSDEELVANARKIIGPGTGDIITVGDDGLPHLDGP